MSEPSAANRTAPDVFVSDVFASPNAFAPPAPDARSDDGVSHVSHTPSSDPSPGAPSRARCFTIAPARL